MGLILTVDVLGAVVGPPIAAVEGVQVLDVAVEALLGELAAVLLQSEVGEYAEPQPVGVWHAKQGQHLVNTSGFGSHSLLLVDGIPQPVLNVRPLLRGHRIPYLRSHSQRKAYGATTASVTTDYTARFASALCSPNGHISTIL